MFHSEAGQLSFLGDSAIILRTKVGSLWGTYCRVHREHLSCGDLSRFGAIGLGSFFLGRRDQKLSLNRLLTMKLNQNSPDMGSFPYTDNLLRER